MYLERSADPANGPPAGDIRADEAFAALWGEGKVTLRRFRDGAIVRAAVWDDAGGGPIEFHGAERTMGGVVERIARHVVGLHFGTRRGRGRRSG